MEDRIDFDNEYALRKTNYIEELKKLYLDTYEDRFDSYSSLIKNMDNAFSYRQDALKMIDVARHHDKTWYHANNSYGMTVYADKDSNNLKNLAERVEYFKDFNISFLNVLPVLKPSLVVSKQGAVPEFVTVDLSYGSVADLHKLCIVCRQNKISVCFDNIGEYCKPENISKVLENPLLFNKLVYDMLMFANLGVDIFKINSQPYKWNDMGLDYPYPNQTIHVARILRIILDIVCPGCILLCNGEYEDGNSFSNYGLLVQPECQLVNNISNKELLLRAIRERNVAGLRSMIDSLTMISRSTVFLNFIQDPWQEDWKNLAALCGINSANDRIELELAVDFDMMLQGYLMMIPGVPFMYLGDELGQTEGKSMDWSKTKMRFNTDTCQYKLYNNLMLLKRIRSVYNVFSRDAKCYTYDTFDAAVLGIVRTCGDSKLFGLFNFSPVQKTAWIIDPGPYTDIISNDYVRDQSISIKPYGMMWLYNKRPEILEEY